MTAYVDEVLCVASLQDIFPSQLPALAHQHLLKEDDFINQPPEVRNFPFRSLLMKTYWWTRMVGLAAHNAVTSLARHSQSWNQTHIDALLRVCAFMKQERSVNFNIHCPYYPWQFVGISDATFASEPLFSLDPGKSKGCSIIAIHGAGVIDIQCGLLDRICKSAQDAETRQFYKMHIKMEELRLMATMAGITQQFKDVALTDNEGTANNPKTHGAARTTMKTLVVELAYLQEREESNVITSQHIPRKFNIADMGVKNLPLPEFRRFKDIVYDGRAIGDFPGSAKLFQIKN